MKLSFGNMTLEINIFNICKQPGDHNDLQEEEIKDKKGTDNVVIDHLSKLTINSTSDFPPIDDYFLTNPYFLLVQCLGLLILSIFLQQEICQLIGVSKKKESF
jgi:hypothetical protein